MISFISIFTPNFLSHLTEHGRVTGFLLQKITGDPAGIDDLDCLTAKRCPAGCTVGGLVHDDMNRYDCLADRFVGGWCASCHARTNLDDIYKHTLNPPLKH